MWLFVTGLSGCKAFDPPSGVPPGDMFSACCGELGTCIASGLVPPALANMLASDVCGPALLCAPTAYVDDPTYVAPACITLAGREGRCLPACLPGLGPQAGRLKQDACRSGEVCVPCFDPVSNAETGACRVAADQPHEPAKPFERCCGRGTDAAGACVPGELLAVEERAALLADTCSDPTAACVPLPLLVAPGTLPSCKRSATVSAPQICLRECFLGPRLGTFLPQASCGNGERCAPCSEFAMASACP
jgi:hypothetical protein